MGITFLIYFTNEKTVTQRHPIACAGHDYWQMEQLNLRILHHHLQALGVLSASNICLHLFHAEAL